jgi:hypothetical protein
VLPDQEQRRKFRITCDRIEKGNVAPEVGNKFVQFLLKGSVPATGEDEKEIHESVPWPIRGEIGLDLGEKLGLAGFIQIDKLREPLQDRLVPAIWRVLFRRH